LNHFGKNGGPSPRKELLFQENRFGLVNTENISIPYFLNRSTKSLPECSMTKACFYFSAGFVQHAGVEDIYVSLKKRQVDEPINLGSAVNSSFSGAAPSMSADGKTLFFASNGRNGLEDLIFINLQDWMKAGHCGRLAEQCNTLNTEAEELFYRLVKKLNFYYHRAIVMVRRHKGADRLRARKTRPTRLFKFFR